jgi:hypothetical protein
MSNAAPAIGQPAMTAAGLLGHGYNSFEGEAKPHRAFKTTPAHVTTDRAGAGVQYRIDYVETYERLEKALSATVEGHVGLGLVDVGGGGGLHQSEGWSRFTRGLLATVRVVRHTTHLNVSDFEAATPSPTTRTVEFLRTCGDHFVSAVRLCATVQVLIKFEVTTEHELRDVTAALSGSGMGWGIDATFRQRMERLRNRVGLQIEILTSGFLGRIPVDPNKLDETIQWLIGFPTHLSEADFAVEIADLDNWPTLPAAAAEQIFASRETTQKITGAMLRLHQLHTDIRFVQRNSSLFWPRPDTDALTTMSERVSDEYERLGFILQRYADDFLQKIPDPNLAGTDTLIKSAVLPKLADKIVMVECRQGVQLVEDLAPGELALIGITGRWRGGRTENYIRGEDMTADIINYLLYPRNSNDARKESVNRGLCLVGSDRRGAIIRIEFEPGRGHDQTGTEPSDPLRVIIRRVTGARPEDLAAYPRL